MEDIWFEVYEALPRQGPGDPLSTRRAFQMVEGLPGHPAILDVGCGVGKQTVDLAGLVQGRIVALDIHAGFLRILKEKTRRLPRGVSIEAVQGDMGAPPFRSGSFDLIWSEGAAYIVGFRDALDSWRSLLRPHGHLVISELVWFAREVPRELKDYWLAEYPDIRCYEDIFEVVRECEYRLVGYFPLPARSWWTDYYTPIGKKLDDLKVRYGRDDEVGKLRDLFDREMDIHRRYAEYYGYGFFVMQRAS